MEILGLKARVVMREPGKMVDPRLRGDKGKNGGLCGFILTRELESGEFEVTAWDWRLKDVAIPAGGPQLESGNMVNVLDAQVSSFRGILPCGGSLT